MPADLQLVAAGAEVVGVVDRPAREPEQLPLDRLQHRQAIRGQRLGARRRLRQLGHRLPLVCAAWSVARADVKGPRVRSGRREMTMGERVDTGSGVPVATSAAETAAELAQAVREATRDLRVRRRAGLVPGRARGPRRRRRGRGMSAAELLAWSLAELVGASARPATSAAARPPRPCSPPWMGRAGPWVRWRGSIPRRLWRRPTLPTRPGPAATCWGRCTACRLAHKDMFYRSGELGRVRSGPDARATARPSPPPSSPASMRPGDRCRPAQHGRVRARHHRPQRPYRPPAQPLGHEPDHRRLDQRRCRRGGGTAAPRDARLRHRRLDPLPGRLLRAGRPEADLRPRQPGRLHAAVVLARPCRPAGPLGRGCGPDAAGDRRRRPRRPDHERRGRCRTTRPRMRAGCARPAAGGARRAGLDSEVDAGGRGRVRRGRSAHWPRPACAWPARPCRPSPRSTRCAGWSCWSRCAALHRERVEASRGDYNPQTVSRMEPGFAISGVDYARALSARGADAGRFCAEVFADADVLALPTARSPRPASPRPTPAATPASWRSPTAWAPWSARSTIWACRRSSLPMGLDARGMPMGLQLVARPFAEAMLLRVAHAFEDVAGRCAPPPFGRA